MPTPEQFASGGIIPDPCACGTPSIICECGDTRCPTCDPTCDPPRPRRLWHYPARNLTHPRAFQILRATDEFHNPTIALGLPYVGMWVLAYPRRLNTALCGAGECQEPTCESYREKA